MKTRESIISRCIIALALFGFVTAGLWLYDGTTKTVSTEPEITLTEAIYQKEVAGVVFRWCDDFVDDSNYSYNGKKVKKMSAPITIINNNDFEVFVQGYGQYPSSSNIDDSSTVEILQFYKIIESGKKVTGPKLTSGGFCRIYNSDDVMAGMIGTVNFTETQ